MKIDKKHLIVSAAILISAIAITVSILPRIVISSAASACNLDMNYKGLKKAGINGMAFETLMVTDKGRDIGISSRKALIRLLWNRRDPLKAAIAFDLYDVRFLKGAEKARASYDTLDGLVALPFSSSWSYKTISGKILPAGDGIAIENFMATSDLLKVSFSGTIKRDNTIRSDIVIYFSDSLTKKIPPELTKLVLTPDEPGWKSLSVKLEGNYNMPTIQVSSKLFRLNIGVKEGP